MFTVDAVRPLATDVQWLDKLVKDSAAAGATPDEQAIWRRSAVRANFAHMEAIVWNNKQLILRHALALDEQARLTGSGAAEPLFHAGEVALLREEVYKLDETGEAKLEAAKGSLVANFKLMARAAARVYKTDYDATVTHAGVDILRKAIKIRDRLTHPKVATDMVVTDAEMVPIANAYGFVVVCSNTLTGYPVPTPPGGWPW